MFSSIRLATPAATRETSEDNGRLETYEVLSSPVRSRLVFLSGCETGLGDAWSSTFTRGEDYATFAQAFLFAGAHNVVATLWRINDRAATAFAQKFYEQINNGRLADALAAAQRAFLADRRYAAPFYWAGYSLSGSGDLGRIAADGQLFTSR
jgi:CHAT domain-containing protein